MSNIIGANMLLKGRVIEGFVGKIVSDIGAHYIVSKALDEGSEEIITSKITDNYNENFYKVYGDEPLSNLNGFYQASCDIFKKPILDTATGKLYFVKELDNLWNIAKGYLGPDATDAEIQDYLDNVLYPLNPDFQQSRLMN